MESTWELMSGGSRHQRGVWVMAISVALLYTDPFSLDCISSQLFPFYLDCLDASGVGEQGKMNLYIEDAYLQTARVQLWSQFSILLHACSLPQNHMYGDICTYFHLHHCILKYEMRELVREAEVERLWLG
jgi:hypothetical protein